MGDGRTKKSYWPKLAEGKNTTRWLFFLNGELHRLQQDNRGTNRLLAWNYPQHKSVVYDSAMVHKYKQNAFTTRSVCKLINRSFMHINELIRHDMIPEPTRTYTLDGREAVGIFIWSEDDVFQLWEYFSKVHRGRPRKDGFVNPQALPTRAALRSVMRNEEILYARNKDGEFVPVWDQGVYE